MSDMVTLDTGKQFWGGSSGRWAGEQLLKAMAAGRPMTAKELRVAGTLQKDEWVQFDNALVEEASLVLRAVADLKSRGLTLPVKNSMGKTILEYEKIGDMNPAIVSLDGMVRSENDAPEFTLAGLPLPITHKDWFINLRKLEASRSRGEALDTTQSRVSGRKVSEMAEEMLLNGGKTFGGYTIYGYRTHPQRNTTGFGTNGAWTAAAKTGENMLTDVITWIGIAQADRFNGPYVLYVPRTTAIQLEEDFKANSDKSIRQRLLEVEGLSDITTVDFLPADNLLLVQMTRDVVLWVEGEGLQTIQWDIQGGFGIEFKAFQIEVPLIRADASGRSGIVHIS